MTTAVDFAIWGYHVVKGMPVLALAVVLIGWAVWLAFTSGEAE